MSASGLRTPKLRRGIGWRLLLSIMLFSSVVTLVLTVAQLYLDYRTEVGEIRDRFEEIGKSYLGSLGGSLWSLDVDQIQLLINGIKHLPDIQFVEVREIGRGNQRQVVVSAGERGAESLISRDYPILYSSEKDQAEPEAIGQLHIEASLSGVYGRIADRATAILVSQGVKTFLVSSFTLFIVHRLVTRHLVFLSGFLRGYRLGAPDTSVRLPRSAPNPADELDDMTAALNAMSTSLAASVSERELALRQLRLQETALDRAYRHFTTQETAAKLAHEIKQPLACVSTYVQGLQAQIGADALNTGELPVLMERIAREVKRVLEIIAATQSRITSPTGASEPLRIAEVLLDVLPLLRQICDDSSVRAHMDLSGAASVVMGNSPSIQQVAVNLVRNACEAMVQMPPRQRSMRLTLAETNSRIGFTVQDTGPGFSPEIVKTGHALFASRKIKGSGFGLPIANAIMSAHGGSLEIANDESGGARVTCWLPKSASGGVD
ncbi:hypothetical protein CU669_14455 [Paramagnetospirillum kuznetsovii]|uniref:histidine kinase n=1 Tax=Paramagnetospirillum kuznetsovii TaxID=2053833 RepID=A0A364NVP1_9PROT|nr:ATP-binding protein [Paramagnetospirillum kuznetsovii]RAU21151.1 hypothetical protein CU669_14455 [Paramagnetospirillum kuznetsovii]